MEQLIRNVTTSITDQLSGNRSFYTPDDLREYDIPEFLIQRVEVEIYRNLNESIVPPHSEWADMSAKEVEDAWEQFIDAIVAEVRMPAAFASTVFETAIADVMEMILQPRKAIPEILFGPKKKLSIEELEKRLSFISVNSHLAQAIHKYMKRKGLAEIEIGTARRVVMKVDERITANYNSLNWAQLLQPLFILAGPKIDTELFRIFFRDRNMDRISRRFDLLSGSLNKIEFIEILSSPDLLNEEGYEEDQVSLFDVQSTESSAKEEDTSDSGMPDAEKIKKDASVSGFQGFDEESDSVKPKDVQSSSRENKSETSEIGKQHIASRTSAKESEESNDDDDSILGTFQNQHRSAELSEESEIYAASAGAEKSAFDEDRDDSDVKDSDEDTPLYVRFDDDEESTVDQIDSEEYEERFADQFVSGEDSKDDADVSTGVLKKEDSHHESAKDDSFDEAGEESKTNNLSAEESSEADEESPIWQSFLGDDDNIEEEDIPEYSEFADLQDEDDEDAPLIDLTVRENDMDSTDQLVGWLKDDEKRFTSHIFSGSEKAYEEALIDLNKLENWNQASRFIEKEIFARNLVDMYDEEAVDFTDRLQAYFDEYKS
ncbi:hypothetical protein [Rhodohalobacter sp. 8-1]|uniref:hypothetical protein n=1 Tax=Rhodohalobacter sp. 8-1 TaxID=3131972 RepID=UPI0030EB2C20